MTERRLRADEIFAMALRLKDAGDLSESNRLLEALKGAGALVPCAANHAMALQGQHRFAEAEGVLRLGLALLPGDVELTERLARAVLQRGDYFEGLALHERRRIHISRTLTGRPNLPQPEWIGGAVDSLLIVVEQGYGDQIMMARYARLLAKRGVAVTLTCAPQLVRLFGDLDVAVRPASAGFDVATEAWAMQMSLPYLFQTRLDSIPGAPYLPSSGAKGSGIGLVARGGPGQPGQPDRSLPADAAAELMALPGVRSLQHEDTHAADFYETARLIDGLELVITVDTAVAHLAGAMGKPTWLLLTDVPDWRWLLNRDDSPWYPSMRIFRQPAPGDWASVIAAVKAAL